MESAVLVIDVQRGLFDPVPRPFEANEVVEREFCVDTTVRRAAALGYTVSLVSDAHTTHDKEHASAAKIRKHHNCTLPNISSFGPRISSVSSSKINSGG